MTTPRRHRFLARLVLAWFALWLGAGVASPVIAAAASGVVCSLAAPQSHGEHGAPLASAAMHCPLCVPAAAPPVSLTALALPDCGPASVPVVASQASLPAAQQAPWSARGPPSLS